MIYDNLKKIEFMNTHLSNMFYKGDLNHMNMIVCFKTLNITADSHNFISSEC